MLASQLEYVHRKLREEHTKIMLQYKRKSTLLSVDYKLVKVFYEANAEATPTMRECKQGLDFLDKHDAKPFTMTVFRESYGDDVPQLELDYPRCNNKRSGIPTKVEEKYMENSGFDRELE